jgi:hypothetical protein
VKKAILYLIIFSLLSGCMGLAIKENVVGNYYLIATDVDEDLNLSYHEPADDNNYGGIIEATVFAIGYNDEYIIVKQHPRIFPNPPNKAITNFYILPIKKGFDWRTKNGLIGPLTEVQFKEEEKKLNIPIGLKFTIEKENLK